MLEKATYVYKKKSNYSTRALHALGFIQNIAFHWLLFLLLTASSSLPQNVLIHLL